MANTKSQILGKVATLLDKFSNRLIRVASQTRQNTDAIAILQDETRLKVGALQQWNQDIVTHFEEKLVAVKKENDDREARQVIRDQSNVQSLTNLANSTQKGFDQVKGDVESLLRAIQRLNERVGKAESQITQNVVGSIVPSAQILDTVRRVEEIEKKLTPGMPSDHVWLKKKLTGVYDSLTDLENRIQGPCAAFHHMVGIEKRVSELETANARAELRKAYPLILELMNNPAFSKHIVEAGGKFDSAAILKAITEA